MDVACDACCLINFLAGKVILPRSSAENIASNPATPRLFVPAEVTRESLYLMQPEPDDPNRLVKAAIDLAPYFQTGVLQQCQIATEVENELFVRLAVEVDDGEAACLALAKLRAMKVATDDRPATRLAAELSIPVINTAQYLRRWAEDIGASDAAVTTTIRQIQRFARFVPRADSEESQWWFAHAS